MRLHESIFDRRQFLNGLAGAGAIALTGVGGETVLDYLTGMEVPEPDQILVQGPALSTLAREKFILVPYGPRPVLVFRLPDGKLRALSAVCTHGQCNVRYCPETNDIRCPCHGGLFTAEGVNVPGTPPPRPLRKFQIEQKEDGSLRVAAIPADSPKRDTRSKKPATDTKG
jgi:nitrite reductase/ring-hydroxylating ferredoxin subunit